MVSSQLTRYSLDLYRAGIACAAGILMCMASAPSAADIWGYVDEFGVSHLSSYQVNDRYLLFKKESPRPEMEAFAPPPIYNTPASLARGPVIPVNPAYRARYAPLIERVAGEFGLDVSLLHAIVTVESGYNPRAKSHAGAIGLMQLIPETAVRFGVRNINDPLDNLRGGARYLRFLLALFNNDLELVLAAYNAGEKAVAQAGNRIPNYAETRAYVPNVLAHYQHYASGAGGAALLDTTPVFNRVVEPLIR